tara:strand:- start:2851 stop:3060 length:210 start_codon:yes stop_codon:yes gene_type:complete
MIVYLPITNRIELIMVAAACLESIDDQSTAEMRKRIKAEVHDWPQDLIIETLLDAGAIARHELTEEASS